jgi:bifunctional aspartokinase / homoserine dehydrogenase 1
MSTLVMKFGGTSVGSIEAIDRAAAIVLEQARDWERLVVVVSAMSGVTDALTRGALRSAQGDTGTYRATVTDLRARHYGVVDALLAASGERAELLGIVDRHLEEFAAFCHSVHVLGEVTPRAMDAITSLGERINARVLAAVLRARGADSDAVDANELIVTDDTFQDAVPLMDATRSKAPARLEALLERKATPIVTGFVGATAGGVTTTLGRGGSDFSAAILGDCLDADEVWIWTDVDGVMSADPRLVPDARVIPVLSYSEVGELAYFGAKVLHPRTIRPVVERGIPLWVKNTFNPTFPGTSVVSEPESTPGTVKAVTAITGLSMVTVEGRGMMGVPGIAARTFAAVASQGASVLMISQASSEQSISFLIPTAAVPPVIKAIEAEMALELARRDVDRVWSLDQVVIVTAVGTGMRGTPGVAARIFGALAQGDINVIAIAQGSSECSVSFVVSAEIAPEALRRIHEEVINNV